MTEEDDSQQEANQSLNENNQEDNIFFDAQEKLIEPEELGRGKRQRRQPVKYSDYVL